MLFSVVRNRVEMASPKIVILFAINVELEGSRK